MERKKIDRKTVLRIIRYAFVLLIVAGLSAALGILAYNNEQKRNELEGIYQKTYYEALDGLNNIETRLTKIQVSGSARTRGVLLSEIASTCETTQTNLSTLTTDGAQTDKVFKFLNQVGDYCRYLAAKQQTGGLTDDELTILDTMHKLVVLLRTEINKVEAEILSGNRIVGSFGKGINFMDTAFTNLNTSSIEYPELIYDGPFSDGLNDRDVKFLKGMAEISKEDALAKAKTILSDVNLQSVTDSETTIPSYCIEFNGKKTGQMEISKIGGYLVSLNIYSESNDTLLTEEEQIEKGKTFLDSLGYKEMEAVWVSNNNSTVYLNFAYKSAGKIYYPDLIKVKMNGENGDIVGVEAQNYLYNHSERAEQPPTKTEAEAKAVLSKKVTVKTCRLAVIPTEWNTEILTYEFSVTLGDEIYYIYVDAETLDEVRVMRVIEDDGALIV